MNTFDRMKEVLVDAGVKPRSIRRQIESVCGVSYEAVRLWDSGDTKSIKSAHIVRFAEHYQLNQRWLTTGKGPKHRGSEVRETGAIYHASNVRPGPSIRGQVPLISWIQAGEWTEIVDNFAPGEADEWRDTTANVGPHAFALRVEGDSMTAPTGLSIPEGSVVIVDPDTAYINGSIVVAKLVDTQEATLKKLVIDGPNRYLKPLNPAYAPIAINGNCRIIGVAKKVEFDL